MIDIIGVGSPFAGDAIANHIIESLLRKVKKNHHSHIAYYDRPGLYLLEKIKLLNEVHIIDAISYGGKQLGQHYKIDSLDVLYDPKTNLSSHSFGLAETLKLAKILDLLPTQLTVWGIEIENYYLLNQMPPAVLYKGANQLADILYAKLKCKSENRRQQQ